MIRPRPCWASAPRRSAAYPRATSRTPCPSAVSRGVEVDADDRLRRAVIERLMCDLSVDLSVLGADLGAPADSFAEELSALAPMARDGLVEVEGSRVHITDVGQPLMRTVCAVFDRYLGTGKGRHSRAV